MLDVINSTPCGTRRCMSTSEMSRILREDYALPDKDAKKVATQIRKSGPLHLAWKDAFAVGLVCAHCFNLLFSNDACMNIHLFPTWTAYSFFLCE